jgi:hypothetical protein
VGDLLQYLPAVWRQTHSVVEELNLVQQFLGVFRVPFVFESGHHFRIVFLKQRNFELLGVVDGQLKHARVFFLFFLDGLLDKVSLDFWLHSLHGLLLHPYSLH